MYGKLKSCVFITEDGITDFFNCTVGTRQGCMLSRLLFTLFINEYVNLLQGKDVKGIYINTELTNVFLLLYADDMVNISDTVGRLQNQINV